MTLLNIGITFNGQANEVVQYALDNPLLVGMCTIIRPRYEVNVCEGGRFESSIEVRASAQNGNVCSDSKLIDFSVARPPTSNPTTMQPTNVPTLNPTEIPTLMPRLDCTIDLSMDCMAESGTDCLQLSTEPFDCDDRFLFMLQICNTGPVSLEVYEAVFMINTNSRTFLGEIQSLLLPRECTTITPAIDVNRCNYFDLSVLASVAGIPPNGDTCEDAEELSISIGRIAPSP